MLVTIGSNRDIVVSGDLDMDVTVGDHITTDILIGGSLNGDIVIEDDALLQGQVIINTSNGSGDWVGDVIVDGTTLSGPNYTQTSAAIGGGAVGLAPFNLHASNCVPVHDTTVTSEPSSVTLSHYGPVEKHGDQGGLEIKIQRHPINISCANCEDVTDDFTWEYSSSERDITITPNMGEAFEDGYEYHITPIVTGDTTLACVGVTGSPAVQSYNYHFKVDVP